MTKLSCFNCEKVRRVCFFLGSDEGSNQKQKFDPMGRIGKGGRCFGRLLSANMLGGSSHFLVVPCPSTHPAQTSQKITCETIRFVSKGLLGSL